MEDIVEKLLFGDVPNYATLMATLNELYNKFQLPER